MAAKKAAQEGTDEQPANAENTEPATDTASLFELSLEPDEEEPEEQPGDDDDEDDTPQPGMGMIG